NGTSTNSVATDTDTGQAEIKYTAKGCQGSDEITATIVINHTVLHASATINVDQAAVKLGSGSGNAFQQGILSIGSPNLSAGSSINVDTKLQYAYGMPYIDPATLIFNSH